MGFFSSAKLSPKIKEAKLSCKFMGLDVFDICRCGEEVRPHDRQELTYYEEKNCFLRLCFKCIEEAKKEPKRAPAPDNHAHLAPVG